jgi:hypothetical protein
VAGNQDTLAHQLRIQTFLYPFYPWFLFLELSMALHLEKETYEILGACFEVYNQMGCGFVEPVYHQFY